TQDYTTLGQPAALRTSVPVATTLVSAMQYTGYGEPAVMTLRYNGGSSAFIAQTYADGTRRPVETQTTRQVGPTTVQDLRYTYDAAGNITATADTATGDDQCYAYDYLDRLSSAWTPATGDCAAAKSVAALGGPAPYWD